MLCRPPQVSCVSELLPRYACLAEAAGSALAAMCLIWLAPPGSVGAVVVVSLLIAAAVGEPSSSGEPRCSSSERSITTGSWRPLTV